jgi:hypothetical protein
MAEKTRAEELHDEYRRKVWDDLKSSTENFDKYMLTFSSGALALSVGFIKDVVHIEKAVHLNWLAVSWSLFVLCILSTLVSFRVSIKALEKMGPYLDDFYLKGNAGAFNKHLEEFWTKAVDWCAWSGIGFFVAALVFTMMFVNANFREVGRMSKNESIEKIDVGSFGKGPKPVAMTPLTEGLKPVVMTPAISGMEDRGLKPVGMTPVVPEPPQPTQPPAPASDSSSKK